MGSLTREVYRELSLGCTPGKKEGGVGQEGADGPSELRQGGSLTTPSSEAGLFNRGKLPERTYSCRQ